MKTYSLIHTHLLGNNIKKVVFSHDDSKVAVISDTLYIGSIDAKALFNGPLKEDYKKYYWNLNKDVSNIRVYDAKWSKDDEDLWLATGDGLYNFKVKEKQFHRVYKSEKPFTCIDIDNENELIVVAGEGSNNSNTIFIFDFNYNLVKSFSSKHGRQVYSIIFVNNGEIIISSGYDQFLRVWDWKQDTLLDEYNMSNSPIHLHKIEKSQNKFIVELSYDWYLYKLDDDNKITQLLDLKKEKIMVDKTKGLLGVTKDGAVISVDYFYSKAHIRSIEGNEEVAVIETPGQLDFVSSGNAHDILAVVFKYRRGPAEIHFYSTEPLLNFIAKSETKKWTVSRAYPNISNISCFAPYGKYANHWIGISTKKIYVFNDKFEPVLKTEVDSQIYVADYHITKQLAVFYKLNRQLHLLNFGELDISNIDEHRLTKMINVEGINDIKISTNGEKIAAVTKNRQLLIWDTALNELVNIELEKQGVFLDWNSKDSKVVIGTKDGYIIFYDIENKTLTKHDTVELSEIKGLKCNKDRDEYILTGRRFINILNNEGFVVRKMDLKKDNDFVLPTYQPNSPIFAVFMQNSRDGHKIYLINREKTIRRCTEQIITYHKGLITLLTFIDSNQLISIGPKSGLVFWNYE